MSFRPRIDVNISNNRCSCCKDSAEKPQPNEMVVFYRDGKFYAKLNRDDFNSIYKNLIKKTQTAIQEFLEKQYKVQLLEIPGEYMSSLSQRLPSLEEVYAMERLASEIFHKKSSDSMDSMVSCSPNSPNRLQETAKNTP